MFAPQQLTAPIGFSFLKLPPPPCAVLLVTIDLLWSLPHHKCQVAVGCKPASSYWTTCQLWLNPKESLGAQLALNWPQPGPILDLKGHAMSLLSLLSLVILRFCVLISTMSTIASTDKHGTLRSPCSMLFGVSFLDGVCFGLQPGAQDKTYGTMTK